MRRIQIHIEEALDDILHAEAARRGRSKASLIRECVAERFAGPGSLDQDPFTALIGAVDAEPADIDEVVYGR